jgi:predicted pyridoxine 5'-phosphate oxidase superfamily flavin-nucleotide-binding protein
MMGGVALTPEVRRFVLEQRLGFVATVRADGGPNLSPKGTTTVWDEDHLMFADLASPQTIANLRRDPRVEVNVVDPIVRKGYRFRGTGEVHEDGPAFDRAIRLLAAQGSTLGADRVRSIVVIEVSEVRPLVSPAYDGGATEADVVRRWLAHFARLHAGDV